MLTISWQPFPAYLMIVGKARSLHYRGASEKYFLRLGSGLTSKHYTKLEILYFALVNYSHQGFIALVPDCRNPGR
jgi:hypothetical protein